jgi:DNA topoisomerase-1
MAQSLIIVESPTKIRTIRKILGKDYDIIASMGHVRDLPKTRLGVDIDNGFQPQYQIIKEKKAVIASIKKAAEKAEKILLAQDPDREGEAISWHIAALLNEKEDRIYRVLFNEITRRGVLEGIRNVDRIDTRKVNAQQARRILDRLVGYMVSPILWKTLAKGLSAGRVQTVALRLICEREDDILRFVPEEYWTITAHLEGRSGTPFKAKYIGAHGKKEKIRDEKGAKELLEVLRKKSYSVTGIKTGRKLKYPMPPFITSTLQQEAHRQFNYSGLRTMRTAQQLYEGVTISNKGTVGLITYMRTDSTRISSEAIGDARGWIEANHPHLLPRHGRSYKSRKKVQDAHEGIRPTSIDLTPSDVKADLTREQFRLYNLIWKRFVASQMEPAVLDQTTADISAGDHLFQAQGTVIHFKGFLEFTAERIPEEKQGMLPPLEKGETLILRDLTDEQHFTKPPPRYTEGTLIKTLEEKGIGRPSTYAAIVSTLLQRKYVNRVKKVFIPTDLGKTVHSLLVNLFPEVFNVTFTAEMESELDRIEAGDMEWVETLEKFYRPFSQILSKVDREKSSIKEELQEVTDVICEKCGANMVIKWGRHGKFLACPNFPECRNTRPIQDDSSEGERSIETDEKCDKCGAPMVVKTGKYGKFLACSNFPTCKNTRPYTIGIPCPREGCRGWIVERRSKSGRTYYSCSGYPECRFISWNKPLDRPCPHCGSRNTCLVNSRKGNNTGKCNTCKKTFAIDDG